MNATKRNHKNSLYKKVLSLMLTVAMIIGCMPVSNVFADEDASKTTPDGWQGVGESVSTYTFATAGTLIYNATNDVTKELDGHIAGSSTSGSVADGTGVITLKEKTYIEFTPNINGTLKFAYKADGTAKRFAINYTPADDFSSDTEFGATDVICWSDSADLLAGSALQDPNSLGLASAEPEGGSSQWVAITLDITVGNTYVITKGGSKITIKDMDFVKEDGSSDGMASGETPGGDEPEPPAQDTTEAPAPDTTEAPAQDTTDAPAQDTTEPPVQDTTEAPAPGVALELGNFSGSGTLEINDAVQLLGYIKDKNSVSASAAQKDAGEVSGDGKLTAEDVAQIVAKVKDENFQFTRKDYNPGSSTTPTKPEQTTEPSGEETTGGTTPVEPTGTPTVWLLGDSTVCNYTNENVESLNWRNGWGMKLGKYLDTTKVNIENIALSGRSTRDFLTTGKANYDKFTNNIKAGDYVLIQFGHNDEKAPITGSTGSDGTVTWSISGTYGASDANKGISTAAQLDGWKDAVEAGSTYVAVADIPAVADSCIVEGKLPSFEAFLYTYYVKVAIDAGANPILVTPIMRAGGAVTGQTQFTGYQLDSNGEYVLQKNKKVTSTIRTNYGTGTNSGHTSVNWKIAKDGTANTSDNYITALSSMNYVQGIKDVAAYAKEKTGVEVPVIELDTLSVEKFNEYGEAHSFTDEQGNVHKSINDLMAHNTSNYTRNSSTGVYVANIYTSDENDPTALITGDFKDGTHLSKYGADLAASIVAEEIGKTSSGLKAYLLEGVTPEEPEGGSSESSSESTSESTSEETTVADTPPVEVDFSTPGNANFKDISGFAGYALVQNTGADVDMADENDINGNSTPKIKIGNKAVAAQFDGSATSGKWQLSVDFLSTYDGGDPARSFRILFENDKNDLEELNGTYSQTFANNDDVIGYITESNLSSTTTDGSDIFYQLVDVGGNAYVVDTDNSSYNASSAPKLTSGGTDFAFESNKWYHIVIEVDLDNGTSKTTIYAHGASYAPETDWTTATPAGTCEGNLVDSVAHNAIKQIRFVRTGVGPIYFDNLKFAKVD